MANLHSRKDFTIRHSLWGFGEKNKNLLRATTLGKWLLYEGVLQDDHLSKKTNFEWSQQ